jgi:hypothetical protein
MKGEAGETMMGKDLGQRNGLARLISYRCHCATTLGSVLRN